MYIKEIALSDIRGFHGSRRVSLDLTRPDGSLAGWTVVAGRNGSGKTSFLSGVALALGGVSVAHHLVTDFTAWVSVGAKIGFSSVRLAYDSDFDEFDTSAGPADGTFRAGLGWATGSSKRSGSQPLLRRTFFGDQEADFAESGPWRPDPIGWFCAAYGPFRRLAAGSADAQRLTSSRGPVARMASLFHEDVALAEGVSWLIAQHLRSLEGRPEAEELKRVALAVLGDGLLPDGYRISTVDSEGLWVENGEHRFPLREMSDGYRTVAALVVDLLKQIHDAYGRLVVDERNGSVAVTAPGVVLIVLAEADRGVAQTSFPRIQFIVTTHSPYVCQAADENGLIRLPGPGDDEPPRIVDRDLYERIVYGSGDDAVMSELFGLDTPYSEEALRLRRELVELERDVLIGRAGDDAVLRYEQLRDRLTSSPAARGTRWTTTAGRC